MPDRRTTVRASLISAFHDDLFATEPTEPSAPNKPSAPNEPNEPNEPAKSTEGLRGGSTEGPLGGPAALGGAGGVDPAWRLAGWGSAALQRIRFDALLRATAFAGGTVLDWGCGPGDLYFHLTKLDLPFTYVGTDIDPRMVELASSRGVPDVRLVDLDFRPERTYDYVLASGIFQFQDPDDPLYFLPILEAMYDNSARAAAATFLSAHRRAADKAPDELYVDAATIARIAAAITDRWVVDHAYHPDAGDLTVGLRAAGGTAAAVRASGSAPSPPRP
ncbi:class I SAM-dependent methyltransferase [Dactylosporangium sucinum]|uniref:Methyltransferase domain-containing protein n=1 Tax=Dactylosporangium sucinum TaxID=1424081 RepID=A0A917TJ80_9ACTN|nr:class I SAM-dependent methyltransferase [Dactylosporangium sucinum]GGM25192.1 hypothetical protein GCM10007977_027910 [Dactylosporangium sucinum]